MKSSRPEKYHSYPVSMQVFVIGIILSATFFLFLSDYFKAYSSSITIFINTKSESSASRDEEIIENISEFPKMLSFYDRLLENNSDIRDIAKGEDQDNRKSAWNSMLKVKRIEDSSMLEISINSSYESDSRVLVQKTARTLFDVTGAYYDIKNDLDLRIIDGPVSKTYVRGWFWILPISIAMGFSIAFFLQNILIGIKNIFISKNRNVFGAKKTFDFKKQESQSATEEMEALKSLYLSSDIGSEFLKKENDNRNEPQVSDYGLREMKNITKSIQKDKYPNFPEMPIHEVKKSGAPENLPIAEEYMEGQSVREDINNKPRVEIHREPTAEELKERLNMLLRGEI